MKKLSRIFVTMMLVMTMVIATVTPVMAAGEGEDAVMVDGSYLLEDTESSHIVYSPLRGYYISNGTGGITMPGAGLVGAGGTTTAYVTVPKVYVSVAVQQYKNKTWTTVYSWSASKSNALSVATSRTISVTSKYYYRVKTQHTAGGEFLSGYTDGIWVI